MLQRIKSVDLPDVPDWSGLIDDVGDLADTAAGAVSSAAGYVPGLDDYRAVARRRRLVAGIGLVVVLIAVAALVRKRKQDDVTR